MRSLSEVMFNATSAAKDPKQRTLQARLTAKTVPGQQATKMSRRVPDAFPCERVGSGIETISHL